MFNDLLIASPIDPDEPEAGEKIKFDISSDPLYPIELACAPGALVRLVCAVLSQQGGTSGTEPVCSVEVCYIGIYICPSSLVREKVLAF